MNRYHCVLPRHYFGQLMRSRIPAITLRNLSTVPQPGDELEITVAARDRSTSCVTADVLNAVPVNGDWLVAIRPHHDPFAPEPLTPAGRIMQNWRDECAQLDREKLINRIATTNRRAALARRIYPAKSTQPTGAKRP